MRIIVIFLVSLNHSRCLLFMACSVVVLKKGGAGSGIFQKTAASFGHRR